MEYFVQENTIENELKYEETNVLKYSLKYPEIVAYRPTFFTFWLNQYYKNKALVKKKFCEGKLYNEAVATLLEMQANNFPFHEYEFMSEFTVTNADDIFSNYTDYFMYTGGANGQTEREADTWNLKLAKRIYFKEVLARYNKTQQDIIKEINTQIASQIKSGEGNYFSDYEELVPKYFDPKNFYMKPSAVTVFFPQITIAPHSSGFPEFDVISR